MTTALPTGSVRRSVDGTCRFRPIAGGGFRAALEITRRCNLACPHCFVPNEHPEPELAEWVAIIRRLPEAGCRKAILTGGEPLVRRDLEELIRAVVESGAGVDLNSNLFGLDAARADALTAAGLGEASVTFYGDRAFHDAFVGRHGAYESTLTACHLLRDRGVEVDVHGPLWRENLRCARHVLDIAESLGAGSLTVFKVLVPAKADRGPSLAATRFARVPGPVPRDRTRCRFSGRRRTPAAQSHPAADDRFLDGARGQVRTGLFDRRIHGLAPHAALPALPAPHARHAAGD